MPERVYFTDTCSGDKPTVTSRRDFVIVEDGEYGAIESSPNNDIKVSFEGYPSVVFPPAKESIVPAAAEIEDISAATVITLNALNATKDAYSSGKSSADTIKMSGVQ
jgi:hypothetical protein